MINSESLLLNLNEKQLEAVETTEGPLLVLSGAGTGKTRVLTSRIACIVSKNLAFPSQILAVTFTNKAANEMKERINKMVNIEGLWIGTFHSICTKILRIHANIVNLRSDFNIIDADDQLRLIKNIFDQLNLDAKKFNPKSTLWQINAWKDELLHPNEVSVANNDLPRKYALEVYKHYQDRLLNSNSVDFGDLLLHVIDLFRKDTEILSYYQNKFQYIHIDEFQDTNTAQYIFIELLAAKHKNLCCVGDDDQSIYGWRGAKISNILEFTDNYPNAKIIRLEQNYRSTQNILTAASCVIANNKSRLGKGLWTEGEVGEKIFLANLYNEAEEAEFTSRTIRHLMYNGFDYSHIAILVRANHQTRSFEESFVKHSIPYRVIGGLKFYERLEIKDAMAYIRVAMNFDDDLALERIINTPKRNIGNTTVKQIQNFAILNNVSMFKASEIMISNNILPSRAAKPLIDLILNFKKWHEDIKSSEHHLAVEKILKESGYLNMWQEQKNLEAQNRIENLKELYKAIQEFENIQEFLEHVSLVIDRDNNLDPNQVSIMTLHASKGLEFNIVFLPGWEEGVFPSIKSGDSSNDIEEERRLAYVGITRARKKLFITFASNRRIFNTFQRSEPSRFVNELPKLICHKIGYNEVYGAEPQKNDFNSKNKPVISKSENGKVKISERVQHKVFGFGRVIAINGDNIQIVFEKNGIKTVKQDFIEKAE